MQWSFERLEKNVKELLTHDMVFWSTLDHNVCKEMSRKTGIYEISSNKLIYF